MKKWLSESILIKYWTENCSQYELEEKTKRAEDDIRMWRTHTLKEVLEHLYSNDKQQKVCMK